MRFFKTLCLLALVAAISSSCNSNPKPNDNSSSNEKPAPATKPAPPSNSMSFVKDDNGKSIKVKVGAKFQVTLYECRGCASVWHVTAIDKAKIQHNDSEDTFSNPSCTNCAGGNQDRTMNFKATAAGKSTIEISYFEEKYTLNVVAE